MTEKKLDDIVDALRQRIISDTFGSGRLPTTRELAIQYETSRETAGRALKMLQAEGLLVMQGRSIYVQSRTRLAGGITVRFDLLLEEQGLHPLEENIEAPAVVAIPKSVAEAFRVAEDSLVIHRLRRQGTIDTPYRLAENFYPLALAEGEILTQMQEDASFNVLEAIEVSHNKIIEKVHEDIITRGPTAKEQQLLNIARPIPVLEMHRACYAIDDTPIMFSRIIFVGSLFMFSYDYITTNWSKQQKI